MRFAIREIVNILSEEVMPMPWEIITLESLFMKAAIVFDGSLADLRDKSKSLKNLVFSWILMVKTLTVCPVFF